MVNQYQPILTSKGLQLKERGIQYDTCWEVVVIWTATGLSVVAMKAAEKMGMSVPHWLPRMTMYTTLTGSFLYLLRYVLMVFL